MVQQKSWFQRCWGIWMIEELSAGYWLSGKQAWHEIPGDDPWNVGSCGSSEKGEARAIVGHLDFTPEDWWSLAFLMAFSCGLLSFSLRAWFLFLLRSAFWLAQTDSFTSIEAPRRELCSFKWQTTWSTRAYVHTFINNYQWHFMMIEYIWLSYPSEESCTHLSWRNWLHGKPRSLFLGEDRKSVV